MKNEIHTMKNEIDLKKSVAIMLNVFLILVITTISAFSQKKAIDVEAIKSWASVSHGALISKNGKFLAYSISYGNDKKDLIVKAVDHGWHKKFSDCDIERAKFTEDSKFIAFSTGKDSLKILALGKEIIETLASTNNWELITTEATAKLIYMGNGNDDDKLTAYDLYSKRKDVFEGIKYFTTNRTKTGVLLHLSKVDGLSWLDVKTNRCVNILHGKTASNIVFDRMGKNISFLVKNNGVNPEFWMFDLESFKAADLSKCIPKYQDGAIIHSISKFSNRDSSVYVSLRVPSEDLRPKRAVEPFVTIWNTHDEKQPVYKFTRDFPEEKQSKEYAAIFLLKEQKFLRLDQGDTVFTKLNENNAPDWGIRSVGAGIGKTTGPWCELISLNTLRKFSLKNINPAIGSFSTVSPSGRYFVYYDRTLKEHCSYDILKHLTRQISKGLSNSWTLPPAHDSAYVSAPNYLGWIKQSGEKVFVSDGADLWLLDASGSVKPRSISNGFGKKDNLVFSFVGDNPYLHNQSKQLLVNVFNRNDKSSGFLFVKAGDKLKFEQSSLQPYYYYAPPGIARRIEGIDFIPLKAVNSSVYIVKRMTAAQSPNYYTTTDFKQFTLQSTVWPEKEFNWLTPELIKWHNATGKEIHGILYKPKDFDPTKKYPVIINYYENGADQLHGFRKPELMTYDINFPWFVSRGYLVVFVDIHYKTGRPGESAFDCINSAADMLDSLPYIDKSKIGLEGHSFGGYETNATISKTDRFAAAVSAAGISNVVSFYGDYLPGFRVPLLELVEHQQFRMGNSLWHSKENYLINSPVFDADKIKTPLLLMHNLRDTNVPFNQATALFGALRRLNKPAWLLQYDNSGHVINDEIESLDYTIRVTQFFDHFLKGLFKPEWMKAVQDPQLKRFLKN